MDFLNNFSEIVFESPVDQIIRQIRDLISSGYLKPGDRLPSERLLSEKFGVGRTQLREALRKLEFYGILETKPQSGTIVSGLGIPALQGLMTDMLKLQGNDFKSLVESRVILERSIIKLAAENRTEHDIEELENAFERHADSLRRGEDGIGEDFLFHLKIADASKNSVLKSLMLIITPEILQYFKRHNICAGTKAEQVINEHRMLLDAIIDKNPSSADDCLSGHLKEVSEYVKTLKSNFYIGPNGNLINT